MTASSKSNAIKFTRFEAFLGGSWVAFEGEVARTKDIVSVSREVTSAEGKPFRITNVFNLAQLQAYAFA
ncbi:hypothetical protein [Bradyrhizobium sp. Cp5.3]|uniref:hypothetical protein n=1 Tax=Bradyrhizobium sp. Cp5.3 TaxID=443598 RepID=UPI0004811AEF|nr:hypothetical protein [Bradyrhizobium sp. Cp5.3]